MYAGVDKYGGVVVGDGHATGTSTATSTGLTLEDVLETAAAEETVVVDVPYSYLENEEDPTSVVSGVSTVLLSAQLNPEAGGLMWIENDSAQTAYKNVVAMSQMTSMLRDQDRVDCYERGIKRAIAAFQATHGRDPLVLDIGTGTGLLAMLAARHGAAHVYACEMFGPMAEIAHHVTRANDPDKITVFPLRSTELTVAPEKEADRVPNTRYHLPRRADLLVSELFDSGLLGEAVVPTLRHAKAHLLTADAMIVPERATVFAQLLECDAIFQMTSFQMEGSGPKWARSDTAWQCDGGKPALPVHFQAFEDHARRLSAPTPVLTLDFTNVPSERAASSYDTIVNVVHAGTVHAVLMWWHLSFDPDNTIVYSTAMGAQNWQDHWVQVVCPLVDKKHVAPMEQLVLRVHSDELRLWFDVEAFPSKTPEKLADDHPPPCTCGLHLICNAERIAMLTDRPRRAAYEAAIALVVSDLVQTESITSIACLDLSDGSVGALLAASCHKVTSVTSIESKDLSARLFQQIISYNHANVAILNSGVKGLHVEHLQHSPSKIHLLLGEPFYFAMQNLPLWQACNFWLRRTAVRHLLAPTVRVLPARARVVAQVVHFAHLHECFGAVGHVAGFDHAFFDRFQAEYTVHNFPFPVYMYPYDPVSEVVELAVIDFQRPAHTLAADGTIRVTDDAAANAVIVWVEYLLDGTGRYVVPTGPAVRYAKQLVRFLAPRVVPEAEEDSRRQVDFHFGFNALEGTIDLSFAMK